MALTLSDQFCVDRFRDEFLGLLRDGTVDILFANESEMHALYETADLATAMNALAKDVPLAAVTRSAEGSVVIAGNDRHEVPVAPVEELVDTTGAGDLYAAGFLFGHVRGLALSTCAELGNLAAGEVIGHMGARPQVSLKELGRQNGFPV